MPMNNAQAQATIKSNTGNATVMQMGHTDNGHLGSSVNAKSLTNYNATELHENAK